MYIPSTCIKCTHTHTHYMYHLCTHTLLVLPVYTHSTCITSVYTQYMYQKCIHTVQVSPVYTHSSCITCVYTHSTCITCVHTNYTYHLCTDTVHVLPVSHLMIKQYLVIGELWVVVQLLTLHVHQVTTLPLPSVVSYRIRSTYMIVKTKHNVMGLYNDRICFRIIIM